FSPAASSRPPSRHRSLRGIATVCGRRCRCGWRVVIAPYEGSQHDDAAAQRGELGRVVIAPYEGSQRSPGLCGSIRNGSSSLPTRDRNIDQHHSLLSLAEVVIAPYEGSQRVVGADRQLTTAGSSSLP